MKKAVIIGATSGIGRELAKNLSADGYIIGITGRRLHLLEQLKDELSNQTFVKVMDISNENAISTLQNLINEMQGVDLVIISAGTGFIDPKLPWEKEKETIETNVLGFTAMANVTYHHFQKKGTGHLVGISSIAAIRGGDAPAYNASKAFVSNYLQGLRYIIGKSNNAIYRKVGFQKFLKIIFKNTVTFFQTLVAANTVMEFSGCHCSYRYSTRLYRYPDGSGRWFILGRFTSKSS